MGKIIKKILIAVALLSFVAVVWATRSGKFSVKPFDYGGELIPVSESTAVPSGVTPVRVGMFIENVYDLNLATQSIAAELVAWVSWPQAFQKLLEEEDLSIEQVITPINRVNSWDAVTKALHPKPVLMPNGDYSQMLRFAGRFYIDGMNLHRYPFERITVPIVLGLNFISDAFDSNKVRLVGDKTHSGVGPYIDNIGFVTNGFALREYLQSFATDFGFHDAGKKSSTEFSQVRLEIEYHKSAFASIIQLIIPLVIVMMMVLLAPTLEASLWEVRIAIPSTALLTLVFLQQGYRQSLPILPYITYLDQVYGACYLVTLGLFWLFVWASNKLNDTPESERGAMIARLNKVDIRFQIFFMAFLLVSTVYNFVKPLH